MSAQPENTTPWYKQFWPWFIIAIPGASIIAGIAMIIISIDGADTLVKDNYYKDGLAINQQMEKIQKAYEQNIGAKIYRDRNQIRVSVSSDEIVQQALILEFRHATQADKDFTVNLQSSTAGNYFSAEPVWDNLTKTGKWHVTLRPYRGDWELESIWFAPGDDVMVLGQ